jgi:flagellar basal-body rod modification protein FlgD
MSTPITGTQGSNSNTPVPETKPAADKLGADKNTFLKLLVAQVRYQNPLNPSDGIQFVTQLAQFTTLEQSAQMSADLAAIRAALESGTPATK